MTAIDEAWNVAKQMPYNDDTLKQIVDSYVHAIEMTMDSLDEFVKQSVMGDDAMYELDLSSRDNYTMADTESFGRLQDIERHMSELMEVAKSEVLRKLRSG
tara:strand:- start:1864 stop:2166 length:303 start_codon:yes stop_codon:yes gene_type:complete